MVGQIIQVDYSAPVYNMVVCAGGKVSPASIFNKGVCHEQGVVDS